MYHLFIEKEVKAKKPHKCIWCGQAIEIGNTYCHEKSIYDGNFQNHKWHKECWTSSKKYFLEGEQEFLPYSNERGE